MHGSDCPKCGASGQSDKTCGSCGAVCSPVLPLSSVSFVLSVRSQLPFPLALVNCFVKHFADGENAVLPCLKASGDGYDGMR
jgi:hypothetical protein